jgi:hypothetical protein
MGFSEVNSLLAIGMSHYAQLPHFQHWPFSTLPTAATDVTSVKRQIGIRSRRETRMGAPTLDVRIATKVTISRARA